MASKVAILSDTHGVLSPEVLNVIKGCEHVIHAGDFGSDAILETLRNTARIYAVRGNCDGRLRNKLQTRLFFQIEDVRFALSHVRGDARAHYSKADVIIYGHTHVYSEISEANKLWLNPGSTTRPRGGGPKSMVVMEIDGSDYQLTKLTF